MNKSEYLWFGVTNADLHIIVLDNPYIQTHNGICFKQTYKNVRPPTKIKSFNRVLAMMKQPNDPLKHPKLKESHFTDEDDVSYVFSIKKT